MFERKDTLLESAESAFDGFLAPRDSEENEFTYVTTECKFTDPELLTAIVVFEKRAQLIVNNIVDDHKPVAEKADMFEALSNYLQTTDAYDSETDYKKHVIPNVNDMLKLFESLV